MGITFGFNQLATIVDLNPNQYGRNYQLPVAACYYNFGASAINDCQRLATSDQQPAISHCNSDTCNQWLVSAPTPLPILVSIVAITNSYYRSPTAITNRRALSELVTAWSNAGRRPQALESQSPIADRSAPSFMSIGSD